MKARWTPAMTFVGSFAMAFTLVSLAAIKPPQKPVRQARAKPAPALKSTIACGEKGKLCATEEESAQIAHWSELGSPALLGARCERFYAKMQARLESARQSLGLPKQAIALRHFTMFPGPDRVSAPSEDIRCAVEVFTADKNIRLERSQVLTESWIDPKDPAACGELLKQAEANPRIAASARRFSAALFDGVTCTVDTLEVSLVHPISKPGRTVEEDLRSGS